MSTKNNDFNEWFLDESLLQISPKAGETVFSIGSGRFCSRASLPFADNGVHGTFAGGLYADGPGDLTWIPSVESPFRDNRNYPSDTEIIENEKVSVLPVLPGLWRLRINGGIPPIVSNKRYLDMKHGILLSHTEFLINGRKSFLKSSRFISAKNSDNAFETIEFNIPEGLEFKLQLGIDNNVKNEYKYNLWEKETFQSSETNLIWSGKTENIKSQASIAFGVKINNDSEPLKPELGKDYFCIKVKGKMTVERYVSVCTEVFYDDTDKAAEFYLEKAMNEGIEKAFRKHCEAWNDFWKTAYIENNFSKRDKTALNFNIFQLQCSVPHSCKYSIGAKFLSGEGYRGMVFWDTDVFLLPWLIDFFPERAKEHLVFRYRALNQARKIAADKGYHGAMYPWQSDPDGKEGTAPWIVLSDTQVHVTADVAWAVVKYFEKTNDREFMKDMGTEILAETAKFWMSRINSQNAHLENVCGPDENHTHVNNNAFTNTVVKYNLRKAAEYCEVCENKRELWKKTADRIPDFNKNSDGVIEQFDGYFDLPEGDRENVGEKCDAHNIIKQADVLMIPLMFPNLLTKKEISANFAYYEPRTTHLSSLSKGVYAYAAIMAEDRNVTYNFFSETLYSDLNDKYGNTEKGLHAAASGLNILLALKFSQN